MKKIIFSLVLLFSFSFGQSLYKTVDDSTNSGVTEGSLIPDEQRPKGFIIKHVKDEVVFNDDGKVLDKDGNIKLIRLAVQFDFDKYDIKDEFQNEIAEAVDFLNKHKKLRVVVEGHTDSKGTNEYNYILSQLRAKKVALALSVEGIDESIITTKGFGETVPVASNQTENGRAQNRRVDISFNK